MQTLGELLGAKSPQEAAKRQENEEGRNHAQEIAAVLKYNKLQQETSRQLNTRAGEEIFKVYSRQGLANWIAERLGGATCLADIADPKSLRLPKLDAEMAQLVREENPETIVVNGAKCEVEYRSGYKPRVSLKVEDDDSVWMSLPDEGVATPGGREVELSVAVGWYTFSETSIPQLKEKVRQRRNERQWDSWDRPAIEVPDLADEGIEIPFITAVYGQCVVTGEDLTAYGTTYARRYYREPSLEAVWSRDRDEAEKYRSEAVSLVEEMADELRAKREREEERARQEQEREEAKVAAESARNRLEALSGHDDWDELEYDLCSDARSKYYYSSLPSGLESLREDVAETEALIAKVEAALTAIRQHRERCEAAFAQVAKLEEEYGFEAAVVVRRTGLALVDCRSMEEDTEHVKVSGAIGESSWEESESLSSDSYESTEWQVIETGVPVQVQECDWSGEVLCEAVFTVPRNLRAGFWAVGNEGRVLYPIVGWINGQEVLPQSFEVVEVEAKTSVTEDDLAGLFGGNARFA